MDALMSVLSVLTILVLGGYGIARFQRGLGSGGDGRGGIAVGDALGPLQEVFHPAAHDAANELRRQRKVVAPAPTPDGPGPGRVQLVTGPDGRPHAVVVRRPAGPGATSGGA